MRFPKGDSDFTTPPSISARACQDKLNRDVPLDEVRNIYMVFAPRFEEVGGALEDGGTLTADVGPSDTAWPVENSSALSGGRSAFACSMGTRPRRSPSMRLRRLGTPIAPRAGLL